jgi:hypothetical protein
MSDIAYARSPLQTTQLGDRYSPTQQMGDRYSPTQTKGYDRGSYAAAGQESPCMRKGSSPNNTKWATRKTGNESIVITEQTTAKITTPAVQGQTTHTREVSETIKDEKCVKPSSDCDDKKSTGCGNGVYAIGFIVLFIFIFIIIFAGFSFCRPQCVTQNSCDDGNNNGELDNWRAGIYAFIGALIFVILIGAIFWGMSS